MRAVAIKLRMPFYILGERWTKKVIGLGQPAGQLSGMKKTKKKKVIGLGRPNGMKKNQKYKVIGIGRPAGRTSGMKKNLRKKVIGLGRLRPYICSPLGCNGGPVEGGGCSQVASCLVIV